MAHGHQKNKQAKSDSNVHHVLCYLLCAADGRGLSFICVVGTFAAGLKGLPSIRTISEFKAMVEPWAACIQVIWMIWDVFSLKQDVKLPLC